MRRRAGLAFFYLGPGPGGGGILRSMLLPLPHSKFSTSPPLDSNRNCFWSTPEARVARLGMDDMDHSEGRDTQGGLEGD